MPRRSPSETEAPARFEETAARIIRDARAVLESDPQAYGALHAGGVRSPADLDFAAQAAARRYDGLGKDPVLPSAQAAEVAACVFAGIAYHHPYFDGNKRTGFLAAMGTAAALRFEFRSERFVGLEGPIIRFAAQNTEEADVARWLLDNALAMGQSGGPREVSVSAVASRFAPVLKALA